ncbi:MAG: 3-keto-5-aminohexanoate cleavage protein [Deltaproteobacteria bacterium]|nr:3-keto-5-aminohexanoate cleavage protein [Deltaproteobacteria bacterium]
MNPLIITAAITGAETTKKMNPALPVTPEEQAVAARECVAAGASVIHLHVRDENESASQSLDNFKNSIEAIRAACDPQPIIQISTGGAVGAPMEERIRPIVELKPEMASLNVASMNFGDEVFLNEPLEVKKLAKYMLELGVIPEIEVYDAGHVEITQRLLKEGYLKKPIHYQFVLGVPGGMSGTERNLNFLLESIQDDDTWATAGVGRWQKPLSQMAVERGGFVRIGFEDNVYWEKGVLAESNAQFVERVRKMAEAINRPIATCEDARRIIGI